MPRYKLAIEYDGTPFVGWQVQDNGPSVQGVITDAIAAFTGERVSVSGAGRTDAGVHALGQVAHIDLGRDWDGDTVRRTIRRVCGNWRLPAAWMRVPWPMMAGSICGVSCSMSLRRSWGFRQMRWASHGRSASWSIPAAMYRTSVWRWSQG